MLLKISLLIHNSVVLYFLTVCSECLLSVLLYFKKRKRAIVHDESELKWLELQSKVCRNMTNCFLKIVAYVLENLSESFLVLYFGNILSR